MVFHRRSYLEMQLTSATNARWVTRIKLRHSFRAAVMASALRLPRARAPSYQGRVHQGSKQSGAVFDFGHKFKQREGMAGCPGLDCQ